MTLTLTLINPNPAYLSKPTEPYQTVLTLTDTVGLQCVRLAHLHLHLQQGCPTFDKWRAVIIFSLNWRASIQN